MMANHLTLNPFITGGAIRDPKDFKGRADVVSAITNRIRNHQNVSLYGERRTGKTSLLLYLAHPEANTGLPDNCIPVFFDFQGYSTADLSEIWRAIAQTIMEQVTQRLKKRPNAYVAFDFDAEEISKRLLTPDYQFVDFKQLLSSLQRANIHVVLLFDEFEATVYNAHLGTNFYALLRGIFIELGNLTFIVASRTGIREIEWARLGRGNRFSSPFFNIFVRTVLGPFQSAEVEDLISDYVRRSGLDASIAEKLLSITDLVHDYTGYHPYFLQLLCYYLLNQRDKPGWPRGLAAEEALSAFEKEAVPHFEFYWNRCAELEKRLIEELAFEEPVDWQQSMLRLPVDRLCERILLLPTTDARSEWRLFSKTFAQWVRSYHQVSTRHPSRGRLSVLVEESKQWLEADRTNGLREVATELDRVGIQNIERGGTLSFPVTSQLPLSLFNRFIGLLLDAFREAQPDVREAAASALGKWGDDTAAQFLGSAIQEPNRDPSLSVRRACVGALGQIGGPLAARALIDAAQSDPEEAVRLDAVVNLRTLVWRSIELSDEFSEPNLRLGVIADGLRPEERTVLEAMTRLVEDPTEAEIIRREAQLVTNTLTTRSQGRP